MTVTENIQKEVGVTLTPRNKIASRLRFPGLAPAWHGNADALSGSQNALWDLRGTAWSEVA